MRQQNRDLRKTQRDIERDRRELEKQEKQLQWLTTFRASLFNVVDVVQILARFIQVCTILAKAAGATHARQRQTRERNGNNRKGTLGASPLAYAGSH
ncbi:hypothetical protein HPB48_016671 [Haemaphysalis longicornis]|uniref:Uncharacterized protein n=1 Tax=Haemaphysalis longicornis TaxID=44386 RepID=A0A9J6GR58_HAELO|nr:hypothetical protein HPB48_016671 [Haemaphysalis longicornis]